MEQEVKKKGRI